jgi:hypothetical protein
VFSLFPKTRSRSHPPSRRRPSYSCRETRPCPREAPTQPCGGCPPLRRHRPNRVLRGRARASPARLVGPSTPPVCPRSAYTPEWPRAPRGVQPLLLLKRQVGGERLLCPPRGDQIPLDNITTERIQQRDEIPPAGLHSNIHRVDSSHLVRHPALHAPQQIRTHLISGGRWPKPRALCSTWWSPPTSCDSSSCLSLAPTRLNLRRKTPSLRVQGQLPPLVEHGRTHLALQCDLRQGLLPTQHLKHLLYRDPCVIVPPYLVPDFFGDPINRSVLLAHYSVGPPRAAARCPQLTLHRIYSRRPALTPANTRSQSRTPQRNRSVVHTDRASNTSTPVGRLSGCTVFATKCGM